MPHQGMEEKIMTNEEKEKVALFKYGVISPMITKTLEYKTIQEGIEILGSNEYINPSGQKVSISPATIERWYYAYKNHGFDGLKPNSRLDNGCIRKIDIEVLEVIKHYVTEHPRLPATAIYEELVRNHYITRDEISYSCINRYVKKLRKDEKIVTKQELKRYEAENVNDIWACDTTYSFKVMDNGLKKRIFIIAIIDDSSRAIVGINCFFEDNYVNFMSVLKSAVKKYGKPKVLNLDNGAPYKNHQLDILAATLGITLHHCAPYSGWQKGKIERWFRTMKDHFMASFHLTNKTTINDFNKELQAYTVEYNNTVHSATKESPNSKFFKETLNIIHIDDDVIEKAFLLEIERKASIDCVIQINNVEYEVPMQYSNKKIRLRYSSDFSKAYVVNPDNTMDEIKLLDKVANSKIRRLKPKFNVEDE